MNEIKEKNKKLKMKEEVFIKLIKSVVLINKKLRVEEVWREEWG